MMNTFAHNDSSECLSILLWSMFRILCFTFIHLKVKTRYYRLLTKREYLRYRNHSKTSKKYVFVCRAFKSKGELQAL